MAVIGCSECGTMGWCTTHMGQQYTEPPKSPYTVTFTVTVQASGEYDAESRALQVLRGHGPNNVRAHVRRGT